MSIVRLTNLKQCINELKRHRFWIYSLNPLSKNPLFRELFEDRVAFLLGGESAGIKKGLEKCCDKSLFIFQKDSSSSYNVSVAVGITLAEFYRKRRFGV